MDVLRIREALCLLPGRIAATLEKDGSINSLAEIHLDVGRPVRYLVFDMSVHELRAKQVHGVEITESELADLLGHYKLGRWTTDHRAGIEGSLHRLSKIVGADGESEGATLRIGRPIQGVCTLIRSRLSQQQSILLLGPPGTGKTTVLREMCRILADEEHRRVVIVDSSDEIAGCGRVPDPAVGNWSRRLKVPVRDRQYEVMREAVQNHNPHVVVVDELSTHEEARAAASISRRGVKLVATAHGSKLEDLVENPDLWILMGNVETAAVSDQTAAAIGRKFVRQRTHLPVFDLVIELSPSGWTAIDNVAQAVDAALEIGQASSFRTNLGRPQVQKQPTPQRADFQSLKSFIIRQGGVANLSVKDLKVVADQGGVSVQDIVEKDELRERILHSHPELGED